MNRRFFIITGVFALGLSSIALAWVSYALPGLFSITSEFTELCHAFFVSCMEYSNTLSIILPWSAALLVASGLIYASVRAVKGILDARRAAKTLKKMPTINNAKADSKQVIAIKDDLPVAFTFGLLRPRIYISTGLVKKLERRELLGVFHHELHHKNNLDSFRLFIMNFIADAFFYVPAIRAYSKTLAIDCELFADQHAADKINDPLTLASAIVKVGLSARSGRHGIPAVGLNINGDPTSLRLRRLIGGKIHKNRRVGLTTGLTSLFAIAFIIIFLIVPVASSHARQTCSVNHCATHEQKAGKACKEHCRTHGTEMHTRHNHHVN